MGVCNGALNLHDFDVLHTFPKNVQVPWGYVMEHQICTILVW